MRFLSPFESLSLLTNVHSIFPQVKYLSRFLHREFPICLIDNPLRFQYPTSWSWNMDHFHSHYKSINSLYTENSIGIRLEFPWTIQFIVISVIIEMNFVHPWTIRTRVDIRVNRMKWSNQSSMSSDWIHLRILNLFILECIYCNIYV